MLRHAGCATTLTHLLAVPSQLHDLIGLLIILLLLLLVPALMPPAAPGPPGAADVAAARPAAGPTGAAASHRQRPGGAAQARSRPAQKRATSSTASARSSVRTVFSAPALPTLFSFPFRLVPFRPFLLPFPFRLFPFPGPCSLPARPRPLRHVRCIRPFRGGSDRGSGLDGLDPDARAQRHLNHMVCAPSPSQALPAAPAAAPGRSAARDGDEPAHVAAGPQDDVTAGAAAAPACCKVGAWEGRGGVGGPGGGGA